MRKTMRRVTAAIFVAGMSFAPLTAAAETLADALISAYRNSNLLEQNRALLRIADEDVALEVASLRPTFDFITQFDWSNPENALRAVQAVSRIEATYAIQASITLFANGQRRLSRESAKETVLATREALKALEQDVLLSAVQAFFDVRTAIAFVDLGESNVRVISQELRAARDRFEVGEVTRTDVAQAESRLAASRSQLANARGQLEIARENYLAAVGRLPGNLQAPPKSPAIPRTLDDAKRVAARTHPSIREAQRNVTVSELGIKSAKAAFGPTVSLSGTASTTDTNNESTFLRLEARQSIYSGGRLSSLQRQAFARRDANRAGLHQTVLNVENAVGRAWATLEIAVAQIRAVDQQIEAARIAFEGTREEARLGARTTLEVLDAEQELLNARADRIQAVNQRSVAIYSLLSAMGLLTVDHLRLGIPTYDPAAYYNVVKQAPSGISRQGRQLDRVLRGIGQN